MTTEYKVLIEAVRKVSEKVSTLSEDVNRIDRDLGRDREDMQNFRVDLASMKEEIRTLKSMSLTNATHVQEKVEDVLAPAVKSVDSLKKEIHKAKKIVIVKNSLVDWFKKRFAGKAMSIKEEIKSEVKGE